MLVRAAVSGVETLAARDGRRRAPPPRETGRRAALSIYTLTVAGREARGEQVIPRQHRARSMPPTRALNKYKNDRLSPGLICSPGSRRRRNKARAARRDRDYQRPLTVRFARRACLSYAPEAIPPTARTHSHATTTHVDWRRNARPRPPVCACPACPRPVCTRPDPRACTRRAPLSACMRRAPPEARSAHLTRAAHSGRGVATCARR